VNKKLAVISVLCAILLILGGMNSTMIYGTQRMTSKQEYLYSIASSADWWNCNWSYCKKITIDHTKVQSAQTDFPVLIHRDADAELAAHAQSDGDDIVFIDVYNTTQYKHEIEYYNSGTGELDAWVKVTTVSSTADTILYMYYGNPTCSNQQNITATWDSNFKMIQHLNESSGTLFDSTSNDNDGTVTGATSNSSSKIDGGYDFDGNDDINTGNDSSLDITSSITLEGWVKDPPLLGGQQNDNDIRIVDKKEEQRHIIPGKQFSVERTVSASKETEVVFAALFSPGIKLDDMSTNDGSIFKGVYTSGRPGSDDERKIEQIRIILPNRLKELEMIAYSQPFSIQGQTTVKMSFFAENWYNQFSNNGRISYLMISSDGDYDFESTTHWDAAYSSIDNPFSIFKIIPDFIVPDIDYSNLAVEETKEIIESKDNNVVVLDVRTQEEYFYGHIDGAFSVPLSNLSNDSYIKNNLNDYKNKKIIVYSRSGFQSEQACEILTDNRFKNVYNVEKGLFDWIGKDFNVTNITFPDSTHKEIYDSLESDTPVFLFFYHPDYESYSKDQQQIIDSLQDKYRGKVEFIHVNGKTEPEIIDSLDVRVFPSMYMVADQNDLGFLYTKFCGYTDFDTLDPLFNLTASDKGYATGLYHWQRSLLIHHPPASAMSLLIKGLFLVL